MTTLRTAAVAAVTLAAPLSAVASFSDSFTIPAPDAASRAGALMPYTRYDSQAASTGSGSYLASSGALDVMNIAAQASDRSYIVLPSSGAYAEWTVDKPGDGVTMRFTMPDSDNGMGRDGSLDIYVNGVKDQTVSLTSYYMYQYFSFYSGTPSDTPNGQIPCFAFDEIHFRLNHKLNPGDKIKIASTGASGLTYGVDFIEIEEIPQAIGKPEGALSVTDFGAHPNDGVDDFNAFNAAMAAANSQHRTLYIPEGTFELRGMWHVYGNGIKITGAGIWHTNIKFTNPNRAGGGISGGSGAAVCDCRNVEICHMYINSSLRSRYNEDAVYKCFMDVFAGGSVIHDIWEDHFECGFWIADYNGQMDYSDNLKIINCRIRNNLADGVNFCQGTSYATVYNCSIRNCGDDGLAMWNNDYNGAKDESGNIFAYNTIDFIWRAGAIAIYGGNDHKIYNNYIRDTFMASGIHLNTIFPGHKFNNTNSITFANNIIVGSGTNADCWREDLAAIDIKDNLRNLSFDNTQIYDSPAYAMRIFSGPQNIRFNNTVILGSGLAEPIIEYSCVRHSACAIRLQNNNVSFTGGVKIGNVIPDRLGNNSTWPLWTDNNSQLARSVGYTYTNSSYTVPDYPTSGSVQTGGLNNDEPNPPAPEVTTVAFNGKTNNGEWTGDIAMTQTNGVWRLNNHVVTGTSAEFGIRVTTSDGVATWYMASQGTPRIEQTTTLVMVPEGTPGAFNTFIADGTWNFVFNPDTHTLTATLQSAANPYNKWYIGLGYGGNDWIEESTEVHPNADGIAVFAPVQSLGSYFRIRMWDGNTGTAYTLYGPEIADADTWIHSERYPDSQDGAFHIINPLLSTNVVITVDVPGNRVKLTPQNPQTFTLNVFYDNSSTRWNHVSAHLWDNYGNSVDVDLERPTDGNLWHAGATIGFTPTRILFNNGSWGGSNQTPDMDYIHNSIYDYNGIISGIESISVDPTACPVYYNMQGQRVLTPSNGLFIVVRGNRVSKELLR